MKTPIKLFFTAAVLYVLSSCTTNIPLNPEFKEDTDKTVGIAMVEYPQVAAHKYGGTGVIDILVNEALAVPLQQYLNSFDISGFNQVKNNMQEVIETMGMDTVKIDETINIEELPEIDGTNDTDYSGIREKYDVDYLLLISLKKIGTVRKYMMGIIPQGSPDAICQASGCLINLDTNEIYWEYSMNEKESVIEPDRPWNTPPDYTNLGIALNRAIKNSIARLETVLAE